VSRIWDSLKQIELSDVVWTNRAQPKSRRTADRRCSERTSARVPIFVYGHAINGEPFYEGSEALDTNAQGGLITLPNAVTSGQHLLLVSKLTEKEQECRVVGVREISADRVAIAVGFENRVSQFWTYEN
jgi:hypothetical protein